RGRQASSGGLVKSGEEIQDRVAKNERRGRSPRCEGSRASDQSRQFEEVGKTRRNQSRRGEKAGTRLHGAEPYGPRAEHALRPGGVGYRAGASIMFDRRADQACRLLV